MIESGFVILTLDTANSKSKNSLTQNQAEQWHAHQGLDHPRLVGAIVYYSPWVMPGVRPWRIDGVS